MKLASYLALPPRYMRIITCIVIMASGGSRAMAQTVCAVADEELQGSYEGGCLNGLAEGVGTAKGTASYTGGFHQGRKHGKGIKTWPWGDRYEGGFANDFKHGTGTYIWGGRSVWAGQRYNGGYENDKRNRFGVYEWPTGDRYAGPWKDDVMTGQPTPMMVARGRALKENLIAMAKPNTKLCREAILGIGIPERIEGMTQGVNVQTLQVAVKLTKVGQAPLVVAGNEIRLGETVWDEPLDWILCN